MNKNLLKFACALALLGAATAVPAQVINIINLQDAGSGRTTISWIWTGSIVGSGGSTINPSMGEFGLAGMGGIFPGYINDLGNNVNPIPLAGFGAFSDLTTSAGQQVNGIQFDATGDVTGMPDSLIMSMGSSTSGWLILSGGDQLQYSPSVDSAIIDVPFSAFNPGTYQTTYPAGEGSLFTEDMTIELIVGSVPEPSTQALAGLGGLGALILSRRRKN